jgi:hypothetical protein
MRELEASVTLSDQTRTEILSTAERISASSNSGVSFGTQERKEMSKVDSFREHTGALRRHMDNTSTYLKKEY